MSFYCATDKIKYRCKQTINHGDMVERRYVCPQCGTYIWTKEVAVQSRTAGDARGSRIDLNIPNL